MVVKKISFEKWFYILMIMIIAVFLVYLVGILTYVHQKTFCYICSPVEHYVRFYFIYFLYKIEGCPQENHPGEMVFGVVPRNSGNRCPRKRGLFSLYEVVPVSLSCSLPFVSIET